MTQQQYELAVAKFYAATKEEPDNQETRQQLAQAKEYLNNWGTALEQQAMLAQQDQHLEKALLLYAKAFQITRSATANNQYKALYKTLRSQSMLNVAMSTRGVTIDPALIQAIDGLTLSTEKDAIVIKFSQSSPIFEIQQSRLTLQTQYISGSQIVANPELVELQHAISQNQHRQRDSGSEANRLSRYVRQLTSKERGIESKISSLERQLSNNKLTSTQKTQLQQTLSSMNSSLAQTSNQLTDRQHSLREANQRRNHLRQETNNLAHNLAHLSPTIEVPVYSDYQYPVEQQINSLTSTLYLSVYNQVRPADISVESKDQSHPAHPTIELPENPMIVSSKQQLAPLLSQQRDNVVRRLLDELVDERRLSFFYQSKQVIDSDEKLSLLVKHGLMTQSGPLQEASDTIQQMLVLEYGRGGEFNIAKLLHLYP